MTPDDWQQPLALLLVAGAAVALTLHYIQTVRAGLRERGGGCGGCPSGGCAKKGDAPAPLVQLSLPPRRP